jgi:hypothetical protein
VCVLTTTRTTSAAGAEPAIGPHPLVTAYQIVRGARANYLIAPMSNAKTGATAAQKQACVCAPRAGQGVRARFLVVQDRGTSRHTITGTLIGAMITAIHAADPRPAVFAVSLRAWQNPGRFPTHKAAAGAPLFEHAPKTPAMRFLCLAAITSRASLVSMLSTLVAYNHTTKVLVASPLQTGSLGRPQVLEVTRRDDKSTTNPTQLQRNDL